MAKRARKYWLMKSEPSVYGIEDLEREGRTMWEGVRNYQARNLMRDETQVGDLALFYHSSTKPTGVAGLCRVCSEPYPDPTQFDESSSYYDEKSREDEPRWMLIDVEFVERFAEVLSLSALKAEEALADMMVVQKGMRLSVQPVERAHFLRVLKMAGARTKVR